MLSLIHEKCRRKKACEVRKFQPPVFVQRAQKDRARKTTAAEKKCITRNCPEEIVPSSRDIHIQRVY